MLHLDDITVTFGERAVLDHWSLEVAEQEVVALLGPSGSGKSTVLRVVAGLERPSTGRVLIGGEDVTELPTHRRGVGLVFQDEQLFPHRDVAGNVAFGLEVSGVAPRERRSRVAELLALVGLEGFGDREVAELSGGEAKRVALARSLAPAPRVLLLDEPLTGLDRPLQLRLADEVASILRRTGTTAIWVTHDRTEADRVADRVVELAGGSMSDASSTSDANSTSSAGAGADASDTQGELAGSQVGGGRDLTGLRFAMLTAADTHDLRRRVLRDGTTSDDPRFPEDDDETTLHLGATLDGTLIAVSTWAHRPAPHDARKAVQLRGMAVEPRWHGCGVGGRLLAFGLQQARATGAELVWARARSSAIEFYVERGWRVVGEPFVDATTGLDHAVVTVDLEPAEADPR